MGKQKTTAARRRGSDRLEAGDLVRTHALDAVGVNFVPAIGVLLERASCTDRAPLEVFPRDARAGQLWRVELLEVEGRELVSSSPTRAVFVYRMLASDARIGADA